MRKFFKMTYCMWVVTLMFACHNSPHDNPTALSSVTPEKLEELRAHSQEYAKSIRDNARIQYLTSQIVLKQLKIRPLDKPQEVGRIIQESILPVSKQYGTDFYNLANDIVSSDPMQAMINGEARSPNARAKIAADAPSYLAENARKFQALVRKEMNKYEQSSSNKTELNVAELGSELRKTIGQFEDQVIKDGVLSTSEKEVIFALTTVNFMNVDNIANVAKSVADTQNNSANGRLGCWICNVFQSAVRIVVTIVVSIVVGALIGVVGIVGGPQFAAFTVLLGGFIGGIVGIINVIQGDCICPECIDDNGNLSCTLPSCGC